MKRCPECRRDYYDDSLLYCLEDGNALVQGSVPSPDEPQTAILSEPPASAGGQAAGENPTRAFVHATAEAEPRSGLGEASEKQSFSANRAAEPQVVGERVSEKRSFSARRMKAILFALGFAVIVLGGFFGYRYFNANTNQIESIAVMPFVNESGNAEVEYLSDGMTETLIGSLSRIPDLSVKARSSVFRYKGKETAAQTIGKELNVQALLTGRVLQRGGQTTVTLELVDASTENAIWSERYSRKEADVVAMMADIARDVSRQLKTRLSGADQTNVTKSYTSNSEAYQLYLKGRSQWNRRTVDSLKQAAEFYKQAIEKDPNYARAYGGLAETYVIYAIYAVSPPSESMPKAKAMAMRALEIDDSLADAHAALGNYYAEYEHDWANAEREFRKAIELDPNYATAYQWLGNSVLAPTKRFDEALVALRRAEELDPLSPVIGTNLTDTLVYMRQYDEAIAKYKGVLALEPNFAFGRFAIGWAYYANGAYPEAIAEYRRSLEISYDPQTNGFMAAALAKAGQREEAASILERLREDSLKHYVPNIAIAVACSGIGQKSEAMDWLEKGVTAREPYVTWLAVDPAYDDLRTEPRFKELLKKLNLPE